MRISSGWRQCFKIGLLFVILLGLAACNTAEPTPAATQISAVQSETAVPTSTTTPSLAPPPSVTRSFTPTETPTLTETATVTAVPTNTPTATTTATFTPTPSVVATNAPLLTNTPSPVATATADVPDLTIGSLAEHMGQEVTVSGTVVGTGSFSAGFRFTLSDGTGQVTLLMWHNVYDDCWDAPQLNRGAVVRVTGEVGSFEGDLQIVPDFGGDVKVTAVGGPSAAARNIGDLGNHLNELVQITGQIVRLESTGGGPKIFVADDTGEIVVFVWNNILERVPNNVALGVPGMRVRVVGVVQAYQNNREIVPALPYDIEVLP